MATLALGLAGSALGAAALPSLTAFGTTITGAAIGQAVGAMAGSYIDQTLFAASGSSRQIEGPRLASLQVMASEEGAPIPRLYGRARLGGQVIWATELEEVATSEDVGGGKGIGGSSSAASVSTTTYSYFANFAVGLCEGEITRIGRVWADGKELDLSGYTWRLHPGGESQTPDSLIEAKQGAGNAPGYRGLAYVVFERMPLARFGNRLPQLSFEVFRSLDGFERSIQAVTLIPGAGEFAYDTAEVVRYAGHGHWLAENTHTSSGRSDWSTAVDQLKEGLPNVSRVSLVVSWMGSDLRAGACRIRPCVDDTTKTTSPIDWSVAGITRGSAQAVSTIDGHAAYGGTPSDHSVLAALRDLKARGIAPTFYPFIVMDVPAGNGLPDPYGGTGQAAYPWRGRITVHPAAGQPGSADKTSAATGQIAAFVGSCAVSDFSLSGDSVVYSGPAEWSLRRMILHYAYLCKAAGGVDAFLIGSELRGLTTARSGVATYPFVTALMQLAADVKSVLGAGTKVVYGADWSEYFGHQPQDGSGDVRFHLDPLWASSSIDAIGIDAYWPLSDWRDGTSHLDRAAGARSVYDLDYLKANLRSGEGYDWHYASRADRDAQVRTPITDGYGEPWIFRFKDIRSWWSHVHHDRPGGTPSATPTAWVPQSKPIWLTEVGCPAVDKGANEPNVFVDPKSAESSLPYSSSGRRDDLMQRRYLQAILESLGSAISAPDAAVNPVSSVYGGRMVDPGRIYLYTWDARPYPAFPYASNVWADGGNWQLGHWLTGRVAGNSLAVLVGAILRDCGVTAFDAGALDGLVEGYVVDRPMSARQALSPLQVAYSFDGIESGEAIVFRHRGGHGAAVEITPEDLVETSAQADPFSLVRAQETDLPAAARVSFIDADQDYRSGAVDSRRLACGSASLARASLPIVTRVQTARAIAEGMLQEAWSARISGRLSLPPSRLAIEPGDILRLSVDGRSCDLRITHLIEGAAREIEGLGIELGRLAPAAAFGEGRPPVVDPPAAFGAPQVAFLDLPLLRGDESPIVGRVAASLSRWPGGVAVYRSPDGVDFRLSTIVSRQAILGVTRTALAGGPTSRWDKANTVTVELTQGALQSVSDLALLSGANAAALETATGVWEVIQFRDAELLAPYTYRLSRLLRGQAGSEAAMLASLPAGARFVLIDAALAELDTTEAQIGLPLTYRYGAANKPIGHLSYVTQTVTLRGIGRRPLSPVHVRGKRDASGLTIEWKRRSRIGGDGWEQLEVPLGESEERYEVDILSAGGAVVRTLASTVPWAFYPVAQQIADLGFSPASIEVGVYQVAPSFGRGSPRRAIL